MSVSSLLMTRHGKLSYEDISALGGQKIENVSSLNLKCMPSSDSLSKSLARIRLGVMEGGDYCRFGLFVSLFFAQRVSLSLFFWGQNLFSVIQFLARPVLFLPRICVGSEDAHITKQGQSGSFWEINTWTLGKSSTLLLQSLLDWEDLMSVGPGHLLSWHRKTDHEAK